MTPRTATKAATSHADAQNGADAPPAPEVVEYAAQAADDPVAGMVRHPLFSDAYYHGAAPTPGSSVVDTATRTVFQED